MSQWIVRQRVAELGAGRDQVFEPTPFRRFRDRHFQRNTIIAGFEQGSSQCGKGAERIGDSCLGIGNPFFMQPFRLAPGLADDPVMGLDYRIGDRRRPFHGADGKDRPAPIRADVPQAIGKVALALPTQACDSVRRNTGEQLRIKSQATQQLQPVEQPVRRCGIVADLELAKPDEPADIGIEHFSQQPIKPFAYVIVELSAIRVSIRRSAATSASAHSRSIVDTAGKIVRVSLQRR